MTLLHYQASFFTVIRSLKHKINLNFWRFKKENTWSFCNFLIKQKILILIENIKCNFHDANVRTFWDSKGKDRVCIYGPSSYRSKNILDFSNFLELYQNCLNMGQKTNFRSKKSFFMLNKIIWVSLKVS